MVVIVTCATERDLAETALEVCLDFVSFRHSSPDFDALNTFSFPSLDMNGYRLFPSHRMI